LPTASKSSRQLLNYPGRWQRKTGGKDGCLAGGKEKLVAKVGGH